MLFSEQRTGRSPAEREHTMSKRKDSVTLEIGPVHVLNDQEKFVNDYVVPVVETVSSIVHGLPF
jgi:hypothetical protein